MCRAVKSSSSMASVLRFGRIREMHLSLSLSSAPPPPPTPSWNAICTSYQNTVWSPVTEDRSTRAVQTNSALKPPTPSRNGMTKQSPLQSVPSVPELTSQWVSDQRCPHGPVVNVLVPKPLCAGSTDHSIDQSGHAHRHRKWLPLLRTSSCCPRFVGPLRRKSARGHWRNKRKCNICTDESQGTNATDNPRTVERQGTNSKRQHPQRQRSWSKRKRQQSHRRKVTERQQHSHGRKVTERQQHSLRRMYEG